MSLPSGQEHPDFQLLFEKAPGMCLALAPDLRIVAASDTYLRATMKTREEMVGRHMFEVFPDNPADPYATGVRNLRASLRRVLRLRKPDVMPRQKYDLPGVDGTFEDRYWCPVNTPILDAQGNIRYIIHQVEDVTKEVELQEGFDVALATHKQQRKRAVTLEHAVQFKLLVNTVKDYALFLLDPRGRVVTWNEGARCLMGYGEDEILGQPFTVFFPSEAAQERMPEQVLESAIAQGDVETEGWYVRKDGSRFWADSLVVAMQDGQGNMVGFVQITRDLTERRRREEALQESLDRLVSMVENSPDAIYVKDVEGRFVFVNSATAALTGHVPDELLGKPSEVYFPPEFARHMRTFEQKVMATGQTLSVEEAVRLPSGVEKVFLTTKYPYRAVDGQMLGVMAISRDITERKRALEAAALHAAELKKVQELSRLKDHFLSTISHEMKTPLSLIMGYTELLEDACPQLEAVTGIREGSRRLTHQIDKILDYSALVSGTLSLYKTELNLQEIAEHVRAIMEERFRLKGVAFSVEIAPETPDILGDSRRITQALLELLENALRFTPTGGQVGVRVGPDNGQVRLDVWDTGAGIPETEFGRIWEAFSQLAVGDALRTGGMGLGLTIVKLLVDLHGGKVAVVSQPGMGSTFSIFLPLGAGPEAPRSTPGSSESGKARD